MRRYVALPSKAVGRGQRSLNTAELEALGLEPSDQDVKVEGEWAQRSLRELLNKSREVTHGAKT